MGAGAYVGAGFSRPDAFEVLAYLRLQPQFGDLPVIVFTGFAPTAAQHQEIAQRRGEVLLKGQSYATLVERLDDLLKL